MRKPNSLNTKINTKDFGLIERDVIYQTNYFYKTLDSKWNSIQTKFNSYFSKIDSLAELRLKLHLLITLILLVHNIFVTILRFSSNHIMSTNINLIEISIYFGSVFIFIFGKKNFSINFSAFGIPLFYSILILATSFTLKSILWFPLTFIIIYLFLLKDIKTRIFYCIFCFVLLFIPGIYISYDSYGILIKVIQVITFLLIPLLISSFIENQDSKLSKVNLELAGKNAELQIVSDKLKIKNEELITFSHVMSHDLKAPLRTIISFSKLLGKSDHYQNEKDSKYLNFINEASISMNTLISDLLIYHQTDSVNDKFQEVDLSQIINDIKSTYQFDVTQGNLKLITGNLPIIYGNVNLIRTLLHNLISNSIKYQPIDKKQHLPTIEFRSASDSSFDIIYVIDNGIGIDENYQEFLFVPFNRFHNNSTYKGTGLGMSICMKVMKNHNGSINIKETSQNGTTFVLTFPKRQPVFIS